MGLPGTVTLAIAVTLTLESPGEPMELFGLKCGDFHGSQEGPPKRHRDYHPSCHRETCTLPSFPREGLHSARPGNRCQGAQRPVTGYRHVTSAEEGRVQSHLGGWPGQDGLPAEAQLQRSEFISTQARRWECRGLHRVWIKRI